MTTNGVAVDSDDRMVVIKPPPEMNAEIVNCILDSAWNHYHESFERPIIFDFSEILMSQHFEEVILKVQHATFDPPVVFGVVYGTESLLVRLFEQTSYGSSVPGERSVAAIYKRLATTAT